MATPWSDVAKNPEYLKLPPDKQELARGQYFTDVVAPQVPKDKLEIARQQFDQSTKARPAMPTDSPVDAVKSAASKVGDILKPKSAPNIDYKSGAPIGVLNQYYGADNDKERKLVLQKFFPQASFYKDKKGNWIVSQNGRDFAVEGDHPIDKFSAEIVGNTGPIGGAILGGAAGTMIGGPVGGMAGAAIGSAGGKGYQDIGKFFGSTYGKTPAEAGKALTDTAQTNALYEGGGALVGPAIKGVKAGGGALKDALLGTTEKSKMLTESTMKAGGLPPIASAAPEAKALQYKEALAEKSVGSFKEKKNVEAVKNMVSSFLEKGQIADAEKVGTDLMTKSTSSEGHELGKMAVKQVQDYKKGLENVVTTEAATQKNILDKNLGDITKSFGRPGEKDLGSDVAEKIVMARRDFGKASSKVYNRVDKLTGGQKLIPTDGVKQAAKKLVDAMPKTQGTTEIIPGAPATNMSQMAQRGGEVTKTTPGNAIFSDPRVQKVISDLGKLDKNISFSDAQNIRTSLRELAKIDDLTPGFPKRQFNQLVDSLNQAFDAAAKNPAAKDAVNALRAADKFYSEGIKKFELTSAKNLVNSAKSQTVPDASKVVSDIIAPGYRSEAEQMKRIVGDRVWRRIAAQDLKNIIGKSTDLEGNPSAKALLKIIKDRGEMMDTVYGKATSNQIKKYAEQLAAKDGMLPVDKLTPDNFAASLKKAGEASDKLADVKNSNFLKTLSRPGYERDQAYNFIVQPGKGERLKQAMQFYGNNPEVVKGIQKTFLKKALSEGFSPAEKAGASSIDARQIVRYLDSFTKEQRKMLLPDDSEAGLRYLADEINHLFPKNASADMAASLGAGHIKGQVSILKPWKYIPLGYSALNGWILARPQVIEWLGMASKTKDKTIWSKLLDNSFDSYIKTRANTGERKDGPQELPGQVTPPIKVKPQPEEKPSYGGPQ